VAALVSQVGQVLARGHALFGDPASGGVSAWGSGPGLAGAAGRVRIAQHTITGLSGAGPARYGGFASDATAALDNAAAADDGLGVQVRDAGSADRSGRASSGAVVNGAAGDTAGLSPVSGTAAGQRALVSALRARVAQQQQVVQAYKARDARLAALVRSLRYANGGRGGAAGGMPFGGMPMCGGGGGNPSLPSLNGLTGLAGLTGGLNPARLASTARRAPSPDSVPGEPGQGAARAALSKRGRPYAWGAKGPSTFDCSGLTQWAWRQAGVEVGASTYDQIKNGVPVGAGQVRAGDLIFPLDSFGEGGHSGPGHVQMAISPNQVVHAPTSGDVVKIAPMPSRYLARRPARDALM
jgi:cell wall-associated NlpC family hydrolase